ncbi:major histocompatibility complex class I-related gene protein-like [Pimephales promelas]|uniref:major histocompatibility complex class I-related gene protein-like n=1 Tax=Pimephales promelas TaxID=90988 RepID=UPI0019559BE9|nr:major histocompatibility complex class I-related gene protein-like [Pimephales promelas]
MKLLIIFIYMPLVYSELHRFLTTYTRISSQRFTEIPEFTAVTTLDGEEIDYYDSIIKDLIPRQDWMKEFASTPTWKEYTEIREKLQQIYKISNYVQMERFTQSDGVHTYQRMHGCEYDDETGDLQGFDWYGYDGEDFISLDLKENRYIAHVPQAIPTVMKWNNDTAQLISLKQYYNLECVYWLREFLHLSKATFKKTELPEVSLLQKNPDYYVECHVTGFLFRDTNISWRKNGQAMSDSVELESRDTLPNEDGTFQRTVALYVRPDEWKKDRYTCVIEHKSLAEPIQKTLTEDHIKTNEPASDSSNIKYLALIIIPVIVGLIGLCERLNLWKKLKAYSKKMMTPYKPDHPPTQNPLLSNPSNESSSNVRPLRKSVICESAAHHDSSTEMNMITDQNLHSFSPVDGSSQPFLTTDSSYKVQETSKDL